MQIKSLLAFLIGFGAWKSGFSELIWPKHPAIMTGIIVGIMTAVLQYALPDRKEEPESDGEGSPPRTKI
jgi:hypothetical protein